MEPRHPRRGERSPEREGPSAPGEVVETPVAACPRSASGGSQFVDILSQADATEVTAEENEGAADAGTVVAEATARLRITETVTESFVPIKDMKGMLQTGCFEGQRITYVNRKEKRDLLNGVIRGTAYFCLCEKCDQTGKALSARAFEQHAVKDGKETNNPNDHIIFSSSHVSMFEACRRLKEAKNNATVQTTIDTILKRGNEAMQKQNVKVPADSVNIVDVVLNLEKRMERFEEVMENMQSRLNTIDKSVDFLSTEMHRQQDLFQDLSKILRKFVDDM